MALQDRNALPFVVLYTLPYAYGVVVRARREEAAIWGKREGPDSGTVPCERLEAEPVFRGIVDIEFYGVVVGSGGEDLRWYKDGW